jgi:FSR family fosmidomycin resistance protein-like MFS transporter
MAPIDNTLDTSPEPDVRHVTKDPQATRFQATHVLTISGAHALHDTYPAFLSPLLPAFIENLALSNTQAGLLSVFMQAPSLLQPLIGHLSDRVNLGALVILGPALTALAMSLLGIAPTYAVLALLLTVAGLGSASFHSVAPVIAGRLSGRRLGRGMGFWMVGGELGRVLGPIVIVSTVGLAGLAGMPWLALGGLVGSVVAYALLQGVTRTSHVTQTGLPPWRHALIGAKPLMAPLITLVLVRAFVSAALRTYLPMFLTAEGAELWSAGIALSVYEAAGIVGTLLGGSLSDRLGRRRVILISLSLTPLLLCAFVLSSGWVRFPLLLILGFVALSVNPVGMALVQESFPENRALAHGVYSGLGFTLRAGAVIVLGTIADMSSLRLAFLISAAIPLLGMPPVLRLPNKPPPQ